MNIFVLDLNPAKAAIMQCDKHVCKMVIETAQLLCSVFPNGEAPYKHTHYNHPCSKWVRKDIANFKWLLLHGLELASEFELRYGHKHKCEEVFNWCVDRLLNYDKSIVSLPSYTGIIRNTGLVEPVTEFVQAMPDKYKVEGNAIAAYRKYYLGDKARFAKWNHGRKAPKWFVV